MISWKVKHFKLISSDSLLLLVVESQFCLKLSLLAALPPSYGGLGGRVIYIDVESKFSSRRYFQSPCYWSYILLYLV